MKRLSSGFYFAGLLGCVGCSALPSEHAQENARLESAALAAGGGVVVPLDDPNAGDASSWDRSTVDLMAADALSECSFTSANAAPVPHRLAGAGDIYLDGLVSKMRQASSKWSPVAGSTAPAATQARWIAYRNDKRFNRDPASGSPAGAGLAIRPLVAYDFQLPEVPGFGPAAEQARGVVALAAVNLCMAQRLRQRGLDGSNLLLPEAEQQQLLEVVRERAQVALLQYAAIARVLGEPEAATPITSASTYQVLPYLKRWARMGTGTSLGGRDETLRAWGTDLVTALQLHVTATRELAELFLRSSAARTNRGGRSESTVEEVWGSGSWRQRTFALLFGGDPLAAEPDGSAPWKNMVGATKPGVAVDPTIRAGSTWPTANEDPFVRVDVREPQPIEVLALAQVSDGLALAAAAGGGIDEVASSRRLLRVLEARLRTRACTSIDAAGQCATVSPGSLADLNGLIEGSSPVRTEDLELWKQRRIRPDHVRVAVRLLADMIRPGARGAFIATGRRTLAALTGESGNWYQLTSGAGIVLRNLPELAALYSRMAPYRTPLTLNDLTERAHEEEAATNPKAYYRVGDDQGLSAGGIFAESMRVLGAVPALVVAREALGIAAAATNAPAQTMLDGVAGGVLAAIDSAIGTSATFVRPAERVQDINWTQNGFPGGRTTKEILQPSRFDANLKQTLTWQLDRVGLDATDSFWRAKPEELSVFAIEEDVRAFELAESQGTTDFDGTSIETLLARPTTKVSKESRARNGGFSWTIELPAGGTGQWTFVVAKTVGAVRLVRPLTGRVLLSAFNLKSRDGVLTGAVAPVEGQYFAYGGVLGQLAARSVNRLPSNPSQAAVDGFGFPARWVPSADGINGNSASDAVGTLLGEAKGAASEATQAVKESIEALLRRATEDAEGQAAEARAQEVLRLERERFCGSATSCEPKTVSARVFGDLAPVPTSVPVATCTASPTTAAKVLECAVADALVRLSKGGMEVARPVYDEREATTTPSFSDLNGGEIQGVYLRQWQAIKQLQSAIRSVDAATRTAVSHVEAARLEAEALRRAIDLNRRRETLINDARKRDILRRYNEAAVRICRSDDERTSTVRELEKGRVRYSAKIGDGYEEKCRRWDNPANQPTSIDEKNEQDACLMFRATEEHLRTAPARLEEDRKLDVQEAADLRKDIEDADVFAGIITEEAARAELEAQARSARAIAEQTSLEEVVFQKIEEARFALTAIANATADLRLLARQADLASQRLALEATLTRRSQTTSFKLYRQYHQFDLWRAKALLDGARRYAVVARRAVEARFATDMSALRMDQAFVAAPASWADSVYAYDLSLPATVGLSQPANGEAGIYANQVLDYVANLERFVRGFSVTYPLTATAHDGEVIPLPVPDAKVQGSSAWDPRRADWAVLCPASATCQAGGGTGWCALPSNASVADACRGADGVSVPVERARLVFRLDPSGRLLDAPDASAPGNTMNVRWTRFAVGARTPDFATPIRVCAESAPSTECDPSSLRFSLRQVGAAWVSTYEGEWRALELAPLSVERARSIASHLGFGIDPSQAMWWGDARVEALARSEFRDRPVGGLYELELEAGPTVKLENVRELNVLAGLSYWTRQR